LTTFLTWAHSQIPNLNDEIKSTKGTIKTNDFVIDRDLKEYVEYLGSDFLHTLASLRSDQVWIDSGTGDGRAILEYYKYGGQATTVGITVEPSKNSADKEILNLVGPKKFKFLTHKYIEDYDANEIPKADLITDVMGAASYSPHIDKVIEKFGQILKVGGRVHTNLVIGAHMRRVAPSGSFRIRDPDGTIIYIEQWFRAIKGMRLVTTDPSYNQDNLITLEKVADKVEVPPLELIDMRSYEPPWREYRWHE
jgi:SAM-dependent methyltransferase